MSQQIYDGLLNLTGEKQVRCGEPLKPHTTFRVGGPADYFVTVNTVKELSDVTSFLREAEIPFFILGNGSNLLVSDEGYRGAVLTLGGEFKSISVNGEYITAGAGVMLSEVCTTARDNGLTGLEFAYGIPGTVGGAMVMNAGAYGGEMVNVVESVSLLLPGGELKDYSTSQMQFGYRDSVIKHAELYVCSTVFKLSFGEKERIAATMQEIIGKRRDKQPLEFPSAGSTFKRPEGYFAGKLIQDAGLSGRRVGGAAVSTKHCGFVVNDANATASDINELMNEVTDEVYKAFGVRLEPEVIRIGSF